MASEIEYVLMAGNVYRASRDENNQVPVPNGWRALQETYEVDSDTGFEAIAYQRINSTEIVISYAGTDPNERADWINNLQAASGVVTADQVLKAADFYQKIKQSNQGAAITFTGHSLGGGLAGLMGVFFNKHAEVFDPAPFRQSASEFNKNAIMAKYPADTDLASFYSDVDFTPESTFPTGIRGEGNISGYFTVGEVLSSFLGWIPQLNSNALIPEHHGSEQNHADSLTGLRFDLHSITLLAAFLQKPDFQKSTETLKELIPLIFDTNLYGKTKLKSRGDAFMELLVRHQANPSDPLFANFINDQQDIIRTGGTALSDTQLNKGLIALATQPGMSATAEAGKTALMLGGTGSDALTGGDQADTLIGGTGIDTLEGGASNDKLHGGTGDDTYIWNTGDGVDTIDDPDGGNLLIDGQTYQIPVRVLIKDLDQPNTWKDPSGHIVLSHNGLWKVELDETGIFDLGDSFMVANDDHHDLERIAA